MSWREKLPGGPPLEKYKVLANDQWFLYNGRGFWESRFCLLDWLQARRESSIQGCMKWTPENKTTGIITDILMAAVAGVYGYHMQHYTTGLQEFEFVTSQSTAIKCIIRWMEDVCKDVRDDTWISVAGPALLVWLESPAVGDVGGGVFDRGPHL